MKANPLLRACSRLSLTPLSKWKPHSNRVKNPKSPAQTSFAVHVRNPAHTEQLKLGAFLLDLLENPNWLTRRVETVRVQSKTLRNRHVSLDIDTDDLSRRIERFGVEKYDRLPLPLAIMAKGLLLDFDLRDASGIGLSLAGRETDSRMAAAALAACAHQEMLQPICSTEDLDNLLFDLVATLPTDQVSYRPHQAPLIMAWLAQAVKSTRCSGLIEQLQQSFIAMHLFEPSCIPALIKYRILETERVASIKGLRLSIRRPAQPFILRLNNIGGAVSEHIRVIAPPGTFFADGLLFVGNDGTDGGPVELAYTETSAKDRLVMYCTGQTIASDSFLIATVWPERRGFIRPAKFLPLYGVVVLFLGTVSEFLVGAISRQRSVEDAAITIILTLPTILISYLVARDNEHETRRDLTRTWRTLGLLALLPLWIAAMSLFIDPHRLPPSFLGFLWLGLTIAAISVCGPLFLFDRMLRRSERTVDRQVGVVRTRIVKVSGRGVSEAAVPAP